MSLVADRRVPVSLAPTSAHREPASGGSAGHDWPQTSRLLPWGLTGFLVLLLVVPFDATELPIPLPVDAKLDRFAIIGLASLWLLVLTAARRHSPVRRRSIVGAAILAWLVVIVASVVVNAPELAQLTELSSALRAIAIACSYATLFAIAVSTLRAAEVPRLLDLSLVLASITAIGVVIEYRTGVNWFYRITDWVPGLQVGVPAEARPGARASVTGPTGHGLAVCTLLGMLAPYALVSLLESAERRRRLLSGIAFVIILAGAVSTQRKSAVVVPAAAIATVVLYRPRASLRLIPLAVVLVIGLQALAPGALSGIRYQFKVQEESGSTTERVADYPALRPDVLDKPLLGRGFGTYSAQKYRYLDNQYLGTLIGTGGLGLLAYMSVVAAALVTAHRLTRSRDPARAGPAIAIVAGLVAFAAANALFDAFAFRHVPYLLMLLAAMAVVLSYAPDRPGPHRPAEVPPDADDEAHDDDRPTVSTVIVTYNNGDEIEDCLRSVEAELANQGGEIVVVDNGSSDGTVNVVRAVSPDAVVLEPAANLGFAAGCNLGVARARGRHVLLLNPDARLKPGAVPALLACDRDNPLAGIVGGRAVREDGSPAPDSAWGLPTIWSALCFATGASTAVSRFRIFNPESLGRWPRDTPAEVGVVSGMLLLVRRDVWDRLGGFDEDFFMYSEDVDLALRARRAGYRPRITPDAVVVHEGGRSSSTSADKLVLILKGRVTLMRKRWSAGSATLGRLCLLTGVALRARLQRLRASQQTARPGGADWVGAWGRRSEWSDGYRAGGRTA